MCAYSDTTVQPQMEQDRYGNINNLDLVERTESDSYLLTL